MLRTIHRELRRIWHSPRYFIILTGVAAFSFLFFATLPQEGQPEKLPVGVVDLDHSYLSRRICHELDATQAVRVSGVYDNHAQAREAMQEGRIFAFYELPQGLYNDLLQFRSPHFTLYTNQAYLLAGSLSYRQLATLGHMATGAVQREILRKKGMTDEAAMGLIQPVELVTQAVGNTTTSYQTYLLTTLVPGIIAILAALHTAYVIGRERQQHTLGNWLRIAGGSPLKALVGKAIPYFAYYSLLLLLANLVMFGPMGMPFLGSWPLLVLHSLLLVGASQSAACFLMATVPDPSVAMSLTSAYSTLSFSLCGFSFPVEAMPLSMQSFSLMFPLRHYFLAMRDIALFGNGFDTCWPQTCMLVGFSLLVLFGAASLGHQAERRAAC